MTDAVVIAIDGPSGAGKGTVARQLASVLNCQHIDTGAMYRAVAWRAIQDGCSFDDEVALANIAENAYFDFNGVKVAKPKGAFYCIAELPVKDAEDFAKWLLSDFDVDGQTVMVAPASGFYSTPNTGLNQVRIAYVLNEDNLLKSVNILKKALEVYPN